MKRENEVIALLVKQAVNRAKAEIGQYFHCLTPEAVEQLLNALDATAADEALIPIFRHRESPCTEE